MSGGGKNQTQTIQPPEWATPYFQNLLSRASALSNRPYTPYQGETVAGFTPQQLVGQQMIQDAAFGQQPLLTAAQNQLTGTLQGQGFATMPTNPYVGATTPVGSNQYLGQTTQVGSNQYLGQTNPFIGQTTPGVSVGTNPYAGSNPYLAQMIDAANEDIARAFGKTAAGINTQFATGGAFGGSAHQEALADANRALADQLARTTTGLRFSDYQTQQQLAENALNRQLQAGQFNAGLTQSDIARNAALAESDLARNAGLSEADIARRLAAAQADIARNAGLSEADIARRLEASQTDLARNAGLVENQLNRFDAERNRQLQALGLLPQTIQSAYLPGQALFGVGQQTQQLNQAQLDAQLRQFLEARDWQANQLGLLGNALNSITGNFQNITAPNPNYVSPLQGAAGGALSGAALGSVIPGLGTVAGAVLGGLGGLLSDERVKEKGKPLSPEKALKAVIDLPVDHWRYKGDDAEHVGTYAQNFHRNLGLPHKPTIDVIDYLGALTGAVQALEKRTRKKAA